MTKEMRIVREKLPDNRPCNIFHLQIKTRIGNWRSIAKGTYYPLTDLSTKMFNEQGYDLVIPGGAL